MCFQNSSIFSVFCNISTSLALIIFAALASSSPDALGITNSTFTPFFASPWAIPKQAVPNPPLICGGNSHPNINTLAFFIRFYLALLCSSLLNKGRKPEVLFFLYLLEFLSNHCALRISATFLALEMHPRDWKGGLPS